MFIMKLIIPLLILILFFDILKRRKPQRWLWISLVLSIALFVSNRLVGGIYSVPSASMEPTLHTGDFVTGVRVSGLLDDGNILSGDILIFEAPSVPRTLYIKRVIGVPGDQVEFREDKSFYINGVLLGTKGSESETTITFHSTDSRNSSQYQFVIDKNARWIKSEGLWVVPEGHYFMAGDNRDHSWDSRYWENPPGTPKQLRGLVPYEKIVARYTSTLFNFTLFNQYDPLEGEMKVFRNYDD